VTLSARREARGGFVVVVDDDEPTIQVLRGLLQLDGFEVATARDADEALDLMTRRVPDAVLSDVQMPGSGGRGLLRAVHARFPGVPVIMMSGEREVPADLLREGAYAYLSKPFNIDDVVSVLDAALQLRSMGAFGSVDLGDRRVSRAVSRAVEHRGPSEVFRRPHGIVRAARSSSCLRD
jgi:DNA-binding NtrC family response regulator